MNQDSVVFLFLSSVVAVGLLILAGNQLFNPINNLAAAEALRPTLIKVDLAALEASLQAGNSRVTGKEFLEQKSEYVSMDVDGGIQSAINKPTRLSSAEEREQPNTQIVGTNVPPHMNEECQYPVQKALDIERVLSKSADPQSSIWLTEYCSYREQMWAKQCYVPNNYLYYGELCRG